MLLTLTLLSGEFWGIEERFEVVGWGDERSWRLESSTGWESWGAVVEETQSNSKRWLELFLLKIRSSRCSQRKFCSMSLNKMTLHASRIRSWQEKGIIRWRASQLVDLLPRSTEGGMSVYRNSIHWKRWQNGWWRILIRDWSSEEAGFEEPLQNSPVLIFIQLQVSLENRKLEFQIVSTRGRKENSAPRI